MENIGICEGEGCHRQSCTGVIERRPVENCSCHISPPCGACTAPANYCPVCGWEEANESKAIINDYEVRVSKESGVYQSWRPRSLDASKIDYRIVPHTHFSQVCEGVYPEGTTQAEVEKLVKGTFGGRFDSFGGGRFVYVAYTD